MGKAAIGGITTTWTDRGIKLTTNVKLMRLGVPNSTVRSGDLDDEKSREEEQM